MLGRSTIHAVRAWVTSDEGRMGGRTLERKWSFRSPDLPDLMLDPQPTTHESTPFQLQLARPAPGGVKHAQDLDVVVAHAVGDDIRQVPDHELACPQHAPGPSQRDVTGEQYFRLVDQLEDDARRRWRTVLADIGRDIVEVALSESCPSQPQASSPTWPSALRDR